MKFNINTNTFKEALESIQVKGKYVKKGGLSSGSLDDIFYMKGEDNELQLWTGNNTFVVNIVLEVEMLEEGDFIIHIKADGDVGKVLNLLAQYSGLINL